MEGYKAAPDGQQAFRILAEDLLEEDSPQDLRPLVEAHRAAHPADPWLAYYQAEIHLQDKAWEKAVAVLAEALKKAPREVREAFHWKYVYAMHKTGRDLQAYEQSESRDRTFTSLADLLVQDRKAAELVALCQARRAHAADDPEVYYYWCLARVLSKEPAEAAALLEKACRNQADEHRRRAYVSGYLYRMQEQGKALEGYGGAADKTAAFRTLAPTLVSQKKTKELAALLEAHAKGHAGEPLTEFYQGELHLLRGEPARAEPCFAQALAGALTQDRWSCRSGLLRARVKLGKAVAAYREFGPGSRTLEELASLCVAEKDAGQLLALLDAHRKARPDDPNLLAWDLEVRWLQKDHEGVLKLLTEHAQDVFALPRHRWKAADYRVRSLVRLRRTADAVREAEAAVKNGTGNRTLLVLVHASAGDVRQTLAALEKLGPQSYLLQQCYRDADLGPILRSEPFREVRQKFPEPPPDIGMRDEG